MADTKQNDGGPAFPVPYPGHYDQPGGMSLRDWFAGQALSSLIGPDDDGATASDVYAEHAYRIADAMLAARAQA